MLKLLYEIFDFVLSAIAHYAVSEEGAQDWYDVKNALRGAGVDIGLDNEGALADDQSDFFNDSGDVPDWLKALQGLTPEELREIDRAARRGGGETPTYEYDTPDQKRQAREVNPIRRKSKKNNAPIPEQSADEIPF